jgi:Putative auto-transporter adhesin, head GIN domain
MHSTLPLFALAFAASAPALATEAVPVQPFRSVELRGGGEVTLVPGPVQRVTIVAGSSQFTRIYVERDGQLRIDACNERCPHNYDLRIQIQSPRVPSVGISGGGTIVAGRGFASQPQLSAAVKGGGTIDLRAVESSDVSAAVSGGGDIFVRPRVRLSAAVNGGGDIHYSGNPQVSMAVNGGGDVRRDY